MTATDEAKKQIALASTNHGMRFEFEDQEIQQIYRSGSWQVGERRRCERGNLERSAHNILDGSRYSSLIE